MICHAVKFYCIHPHAFQQLSGKHGFCHRSSAHQTHKLACTQRAKTEFLKSMTTKLVYRKFKRIKTMNTLFAAPISRLNSLKLWQWIPMNRSGTMMGFILFPWRRKEVHTKTIPTVMNLDSPSTMTSCEPCWWVKTKRQLWAQNLWKKMESDEKKCKVLLLKLRDIRHETNQHLNDTSIEMAFLALGKNVQASCGSDSGGVALALHLHAKALM